MNTEEKDLVEALTRQADFHIIRFDKRREYSWKIALAFWGAILGAATLLKDTSFSIWWLIMMGVVIIALHTIWLYGVFIADQKDKWVAFQCRDKCLEIINKSLNAPIQHPLLSHDRRFLKDWSVIFQILMTLSLVLAVVFLILH